MKVVYRFPGLTTPPAVELLSARVLSRLAVAAEAAGIAAVALDEHPAPPQRWRLGGDGHDSLDPFVGLASVVAATSAIRLFVYATIVPVRNPFLLAKAAATLDVVSDGRLELGLAGGYLEEELEALGVDFASRNERFDESIEMVKRAWTGEPITASGAGFVAVDVAALPTPLQLPHPRLWFAGNSRTALKRVATHGGGWMALPNPRGRAVSRRTAPIDTIDDLRSLIGQLSDLTAEAGRTEPPDVVYSIDATPSGDPSRLADTLDELSDAGVGWVNVTAHEITVDDALRTIDWIGRDIARH